MGRTRRALWQQPEGVPKKTAPSCSLERKNSATLYFDHPLKPIGSLLEVVMSTTAGACEGGRGAGHGK